MRTARNILIYFSLKYQGDWDKIFSAINAKEEFDEEEFEKLIKTVKSNTITILDKEYPETLKTIFKPPFVLYYYGDISLIETTQDRLAVIGSRECTEYGAFCTKKLVSEVCDEIIIVSGMAKGIDSISHEAALENNAKTVAVLGSGIDVCYPIENKSLYQRICKKGLVISEYPNETSPNTWQFPNRNRLISGFASGILVTEAHLKSGTAITVRCALEQGKEVMTVPYPIGQESACNRWIKEGASLVECGDDIKFVLG